MFEFFSNLKKTRETFNKYFEFKSNGDSYKNLSLPGYLDEICSDFIDNLKGSNNTWKIQLIHKIILKSTKDKDEERNL